VRAAPPAVSIMMAALPLSVRTSRAVPTMARIYEMPPEPNLRFRT
jgi:hypothetical protein